MWYHWHKILDFFLLLQNADHIEPSYTPKNLYFISWWSSDSEARDIFKFQVVLNFIIQFSVLWNLKVSFFGCSGRILCHVRTSRILSFCALSNQVINNSDYSLDCVFHYDFSKMSKVIIFRSKQEPLFLLVRTERSIL